MIWQDIALTAASVIFSISLLPQVYHGFKEKTGTIKFLTSVPTFIGLYAVSAIYWTLGLYFSAVVSFITGTLWFLLVCQRLRYNQKKLVGTADKAPAGE
ncbi:MAG: hypothetical protein UY92_C0014G0026 [Candidatus Magasanikbacteria bacterium GW2011_GWA2_56_11]|uniref:MtN3 and saliva related transmembrane protein n=1 Tax=Candidatus Magasanikbacteria bacterium GW2011_GWA2_56_11 TaxID=1619044 RepID=A0A0G1YEQ9_9BACT|nr:MAG: hypothetical protein UY92_C0014G0026 [Candidatus Magasanikbacteria bacterium GW2011_GWA2_56_11]